MENLGSAHIKLNNISRALNIILHRKSISRVDLVRETGLSAMSITRICSTLIKEGLIRDGSFGGNAVGRKATLLEPCERSCFFYCIAIDFGVTQLAIYDLTLTRVAYREMLAGDGATYEQIIDLAYIALAEMARKGNVPPDKIIAVGISSVGGVNDGVLEFVAQFRWNEVHAADYANNLFKLPVFVENDCKAALVGEHSLQFGLNGPHNVAYVHIGKRGVGSAAIINGELLRGADNLAGEIGHITVELNGMACDCGRRGCLQTFLSEQFILARANSYGRSFSDLYGLMNAAASGDRAMAGLLQTIRQYAAVALNIIACAYDPDVIILNDSFFQHTYHDWYTHAQQQMPQYLLRPMLERVSVHKALLGSDASLFGIARILQGRLIELLHPKHISLFE